MAWWSRNNFTPSDKLHADDLNNLANDIRTWGGDVNGGGHVLSNVILASSVARAAVPVTSVFGRTGDIVATAGDYTAAQVGAVPVARQVIAGAGLLGGGALSADVTLSAAVPSVFGRTGAVTLTPSDISGATGVLTTRAINTGMGLTGGGNLSADRTFAVVPDTTNQQVQVLLAGAAVGMRHALNFISGANVAVGITDDAPNNRLNVTVSSTGGAGGMVDPTTTLGDLIVRGPSIPGRLPVGPDGQVLTADATQPLGVKWAPATAPSTVTSVFSRTGAIVAQAGDYTAAQVTNAVDYTQSYVNPPWITSIPWSKITNAPAFMVDPTTTKGDLITRTAAASTRIPAGADGTVLTADSTQAAGLRWAPVIGVASIFGRSGTVTAQAGDYTVAQVTGAVPNTRIVNTGLGLSGGGNLGADRTIAVVPDTTDQRVQVLNANALIGTRHALNFVAGSNMSVSIDDDGANNRVNLTFASTGSGGGGLDPTTTLGDLIVRGAASVQRLPVGTNGQVLTADSTQPLGVRWATGGGGGQSPWLSDVDAANYRLHRVQSVGVNQLADSTVSRLYVQLTGTEEGLTILGGTDATAHVNASLRNDVGHYLRFSCNGSSATSLANMAVLSTDGDAMVFDAAGERMRIRSDTGDVLIGTTTDDTVNRLQVAGSIKSTTGGFVFPDGTTQATAAVVAVASVFGRTGAVAAQAADYTAAQVTNAVDQTATYADPAWITSLAWAKITGAPVVVTSAFGRTGAVVATAGDYTAAQVTNAVSTAGTYADPAWITSLSWAKITGTPAIPSQTPWTQDIDAATFQLKNAGSIGIGTNPPTQALDIYRSGSVPIIQIRGEWNTPSMNAQLAGYSYSGSSPNYGLVLHGYAARGTQAAPTPLLGADVCFLLAGDGCSANGVLTNVSPVQIRGSAGSTWTSTSTETYISFHTAASGTTAPVEKARITGAGRVGIGETSPLGPLHIAGNSSGYSIYIDPNSGHTGGPPGLALGSTNNNAAIQSFGNTILLINPAGGNVSIGYNADQSHKLAVNGDTYTNGWLYGNLLQISSDNVGYFRVSSYSGLVRVNAMGASGAGGELALQRETNPSSGSAQVSVWDGGANRYAMFEATTRQVVFDSSVTATATPVFSQIYSNPTLIVNKNENQTGSYQANTMTLVNGDTTQNNWCVLLFATKNTGGGTVGNVAIGAQFVGTRGASGYVQSDLVLAAGWGGGPAEAMRIKGSNGNVLIGTITDYGYKLYVEGPLRANATIMGQVFQSLGKGNIFGVPTGPNTNPNDTDCCLLLYHNSTSNWAGWGCGSDGAAWLRVGGSGNPNPVILATPGGNIVLNCPTSMNAAAVQNNQLSFAVQEAGNALQIAVRYSNGTVKYGYVTLA